MSQTLEPGSLSGRTALVTGSSRGIGADTARYLAEAGATLVINYRNTAPRAEKLASELRELGVEVLVVGADLTDAASVQAMFDEVQRTFGGLDVLVLNASGGMESGMAEDYALQLNRDAQVRVLETAVPILREGSRVVFVTSHQAHFIRTTPTMPEYEPVTSAVLPLSEPGSRVWDMCSAPGCRCPATRFGPRSSLSTGSSPTRCRVPIRREKGWRCCPI